MRRSITEFLTARERRGVFLDTLFHPTIFCLAGLYVSCLFRCDSNDVTLH